MNQSLIKAAVRARFLLTGRNQADRRIRAALSRYLSLARGIDSAHGRRHVRVPPMPGVDEDMRDWSFFMILEHNIIVNRSISAVVDRLVQGLPTAGAGAIDAKKDVMPTADAGAEQVAALKTSVENYLRMASGPVRLRGTATVRHPIFDDLDAHGWHCMFGLHLEIHLRQARAVVRAIGSHPSAGPHGRHFRGARHD
ncbi:MAG TPA: hypothetical protein VLT88_05530 [Desulfosarcina sp.]|nr:hypothetical protein [Desulfosarcina sp.]